MLPFSLTLRSGEPVVEQVVYAVTRAVVSGQLRPGDRFPSVRALSQELKVNPNTAQRIVALLSDAGLLAVEPGIGTVVTERSERGVAPKKAEVSALGDRLAELLAVEARRLGLGLTDVLDLVRDRWKRLTESR